MKRERSKNSSTRMIASSIIRLYARCIPLCDSTFFTLRMTKSYK
ncbi:putative hybrid sensory histidine kinase TorS [Escherichia coli MS 196-1]|nr:putative hybrid sensory histidine kinase TorS [Escherichia coli MS 196-1]